jgi:hypothetical protein
MVKRLSAGFVVLLMQFLDVASVINRARSLIRAGMRCPEVRIDSTRRIIGSGAASG